MRSGGGVLRMKHLIWPFSPWGAWCVWVLEIVGGPAVTNSKHVNIYSRAPGINQSTQTTTKPWLFQTFWSLECHNLRVVAWNTQKIHRIESESRGVEKAEMSSTRVYKSFRKQATQYQIGRTKKNKKKNTPLKCLYYLLNMFICHTSNCEIHGFAIFLSERNLTGIIHHESTQNSQWYWHGGEKNLYNLQNNL